MGGASGLKLVRTCPGGTEEVDVGIRIK